MKFTALQQYLDSGNTWSAIFGQAAITMPLSQQDIEQLAQQLSGELSPENLTCDGEASPAMVRKRLNHLHNVRQDLEVYAESRGLELPYIHY